MKSHLQLPQGFLNSQKLDLELNRLFASAYGIKDFDDLPYPFKCAAVDIENGEVVVLDNGFLGRAVRASMAIPSVFSPVEIDGRLLVDGGLIRNFPVDEAIGMGADIIIGVYVGSTLEQKEKLNNLVEILNQSAFMMGILDSDIQKESVDLLIQPDVKDYPSFGFDLTETYIKEGYISAAEQIDKIRALARSQSVYNLTAPRALPVHEQFDITTTGFPLMTPPYSDLAIFKYGNKINGLMDLEEIDQGINRIFGTKHFQNVNYTFEENQTSSDIDLTILGRPRHVQTLSASFNFLPSSSTALVLTHELRNIVSMPSVLFTTVRLAENYGLKLDYNYRLGLKKDFIFNSLFLLHKYDQNLYEGELLRKRFSEISGLGMLGVSFEPNNDFIFSAHAGLRRTSFKPIGLDEEGLIRYGRWDGLFELSMEYNTVDDVQFASNGLRITGSIGAAVPIGGSIRSGDSPQAELFEDKTYAEIAVKGEGYYSIAPKVSALYSFSGGYKTAQSFTDNFRIGGLEDRDEKSISLLGLNTHQVHFNRYYRLGGGLRVQLFSNVYVTVRADVIDGIRTFISSGADVASDLSFMGLGGILGVRTPIGPISISHGRNTLTDSWNTNFRVGYSFF